MFTLVNLMAPPSLKATPEELQRFLDMEPTKHFGDASTFSGAQAPEGKLPGTAPSRVLLQQLHDAGTYVSPASYPPASNMSLSPYTLLQCQANNTLYKVLPSVTSISPAFTPQA